MIFLLVAAALAAAYALSAAYARAYAKRVNAIWPADGRFIDAHGARLHLRETGDASAPRVLLIHGASANLRELWHPLADDLARDHRVIAFDRPGYGHSTRPRSGAEQLKTQALMAAAVLEASGEGPAIIVGHSLGAGVSLRLALERPDLVSALVLIAPASHTFAHNPAWWARLSATPIVGHIFCTCLIPWLGPLLSRASIANNFWPSKTPANYFNDGGIGLIFRATAFRASARDVCASKSEFAAQQARYQNLLTPAIIVTAEKDKIVSPKRHARALAADLQASELVIAPAAGHMPHRLRPDLVLSAVRRVGSMVTAPAER
jgi:pimeloyl-ACP methyl ester carboxylesterase